MADELQSPERDMEFAMMDGVVEACRKCGITTIMGYYYPTAKNAMVKKFYESQGFVLQEETNEGISVWKFTIPDEYVQKNTVITVNK